MSGDWEFYEQGSLNVESYDSQAQAGHPVLGGDVEFDVEQARKSGGPVLDLGCGTGRVAWPLAKAGFEVTSLDRSAPMLARSEAKRAVASPAAQGRVQLVNADVRDFDLPTQFGLVIAPGRTFQLLLTPATTRLGAWLTPRLLTPCRGLSQRAPHRAGLQTRTLATIRRHHRVPS